jgi:tellurite resistance protein
MYLNRINENCKYLFLELAKSIGRADGDFTDAEKEMVNEYCREMQIADIKEPSGKDNETIMKELADLCNKQERKIIVLELIGLAHADKIFSVEERDFIAKLADTFHMEVQYVQACENLIKKYFDIQIQFEHLIFD